ncbi:MAG: histidine kinase [Myxococcales bacterium]|nr:histidine kinase [Myxococcales bacterium]
MPRGCRGTRANAVGVAPRWLSRTGVLASILVSTVQRVLLVGPDDAARRSLHLMLDRGGKQVVAVTELEAAQRYLETADCDAVIAPGELAPQLAGGRSPPVIAIVSSRDPAVALALLDGGVHDVVSEPIDELAIVLALRRAGTRVRTATVSPANGTRADKREIIGAGEGMQELREVIARVAGHRTTVLIAGESGTGKELVARAIHDASPRSSHRFIAINCAAIPATLLEAELFGHTKGAFTDAVRDRVGLFEEAHGGTLFLDEVGEIPLPLQAKLLRALQEGEIRRVGDTDAISIDVRVIAATLRDLAAEVTAGRFREDLYYRLNVVPVTIPPLRERPEDIPLLARFFAARHGAHHQRASIQLSDDAIEALSHQPWPGNVRELENIIERAIVLADGPTIDLAFLETVMNVRAAPPATDTGQLELSIKKGTRDLEEGLIKRALVVTQGNRTNAAKLLEISHRALLYKMKEYGIT